MLRWWLYKCSNVYLHCSFINFTMCSFTKSIVCFKSQGCPYIPSLRFRTNRASLPPTLTVFRKTLCLVNQSFILLNTFVVCFCQSFKDSTTQTMFCPKRSVPDDYHPESLSQNTLSHPPYSHPDIVFLSTPPEMKSILKL